MRNASLRLLVLTDHRNHQPYESLYPLLRAMRRHPACASISVASRSHPGNAAFFEWPQGESLHTVAVNSHFFHDRSRDRLGATRRRERLDSFDLVLLRLPKPNPADWFRQIEVFFGNTPVINRPSGILETGSKAYLSQFTELCPPLKVCYTLDELLDFGQQFPIVLKPFRDAGGRGILKLEGTRLWKGKEEVTLADYLPELQAGLKNGYLAMQYLERVSQGDKRVLMVNGAIVGASLRLPAQDSWLCNVNMGGSAVATNITPEEYRIAAVLGPALAAKGVVIVGFDTLEDQHGKRVLSEINASNPGGFLPSQLLSGEPVIRRTANLLWSYILTNLFSQPKAFISISNT
jgi:glutathione synthase